MNPLYDPNNSPNGATHPTKAVNHQYPKKPRNYSDFDLSYFNFTTQPYGKVVPYFIMETVAGDKVRLANSHGVRSLAMQSPFMQSLKLCKDNFYIPMQALQPNTWEYLFRNPSQGEDIPDDVACRADHLYENLQYYLNTLKTDLTNISGYQAGKNYSDVERAIVEPLICALQVEFIASEGALLSRLGFKIPIMVNDKPLDVFLDEFWNAFLVPGMYFTLDNGTRVYLTDTNVHVDLNPPVSPTNIYVGRAQFLDYIRDRYCSFVNANYGVRIKLGTQAVGDAFIASAKSLTITSFKISPIGVVNLLPVFAYQVACWQYIVNPTVDFIYSADIYRQLVFQLMKGAKSGLAPQFFQYNGTDIQYDIFSGMYLNTLFPKSPDRTPDVDSLALIQSIFGINSALYFGDYFTDCRTTPLGVGNNDIAVTNNKVSVIDVTKSIVMQRFRNSVAKIGSTFGDYLKGIFSSQEGPDYHYPKFISHKEFDINATETTNTSENQGAITSQLMSGDDTTQFEVDIDMPGYLIGLSYFRMPRVYSFPRDRMFRHQYRFDYFHPFMQFIGDQNVTKDEKCAFCDDTNYGYHARHMEYKQRYSLCSGAFMSVLANWLSVSDSLGQSGVVDYEKDSQSPDAIRCKPYEFDRFFALNTRLSLAHRFHFICQYNNKIQAQRPMIVAPDIL